MNRQTATVFAAAVIVLFGPFLVGYTLAMIFQLLTYPDNLFPEMARWSVPGAIGHEVMRWCWRLLGLGLIGWGCWREWRDAVSV